MLTFVLKIADINYFTIEGTKWCIYNLGFQSCCTLLAIKKISNTCNLYILLLVPLIVKQLFYH